MQRGIFVVLGCFRRGVGPDLLVFAELDEGRAYLPPQGAIRHQIREWLQHEAPPPELSMRDRQRGRRYPKIAEEQDIKVDRSRPPPLPGPTAHSPLNRLYDL